MSTKYLLGVTYFLVTTFGLSNYINATATVEELPRIKVRDKTDYVEVKCQKGNTILADL